jgi:hypothetical protein
MAKFDWNETKRQITDSQAWPVFAQAPSKAEKRRLILKGSKLWPVYCNQCHNARPPGEKAPYEWDQEIMHMRMLGNIPADDARALVEYLKTR